MRTAYSPSPPWILGLHVVDGIDDGFLVCTTDRENGDLATEIAIGAISPAKSCEPSCESRGPSCESHLVKL
jgi:hypothetical protein